MFIGKQDVKCKQLAQLLFVCLIISPIIIIGLISIKSDNQKLETNSKIVKAKIYKSTRAKGTRHNYYQFIINDVVFNKGFVSSWDLKKGDMIFVRYNCEKPEINEAVSHNGSKFVLECDSLLIE